MAMSRPPRERPPMPGPYNSSPPISPRRSVPQSPNWSSNGFPSSTVSSTTSPTRTHEITENDPTGHGADLSRLNDPTYGFRRRFRIPSEIGWAAMASTEAPPPAYTDGEGGVNAPPRSSSITPEVTPLNAPLPPSPSPSNALRTAPSTTTTTNALELDIPTRSSSVPIQSDPIPTIVPTPTAEQTVVLQSGVITTTAQIPETETEVKSFDSLLESIIKEELLRVQKDHKEEMFLAESKRATAIEPTTVDPFPELPLSPSTSILSPTLNETKLSPTLMRSTSLLIFRLRNALNSRLEQEATNWRNEKARGLKEFEGIEKEKDDLENERDELNVRIKELERTLSRERKARSEDLEAASMNAQFLQEEITILQSAVKDFEADRSSHRASTSNDVDSDNIWKEIVDETSEILTRHTMVIKSLTTTLTCSICSEILDNACTLKCGHSTCSECINGWFRRGNRTCPECRSDVGAREGLAPSYCLREVVERMRPIGLGDD